jgi:hypothetical protein
MEKIASCEGIVLFANQCSAIILKGSWDEDGFYPEGVTDVHFNTNMFGENRLFLGDVINVKVSVKKSGGEESIEWLEEIAVFYEDTYDRADIKKEILKWLKEGIDFKKKYIALEPLSIPLNLKSLVKKEIIRVVVLVRVFVKKNVFINIWN